MSTDNTARDFIRALIAGDLHTGKHGGRVVTRFPPEPNGYLHIGHAKAICLNFGIAEEIPGARCHLRFDDTNPETEDIKYVDAAIADVTWLGFDWGEHLYFASDYFDAMYAFAEHLIRQGRAYIDSSSEDEIREARGTITEPGRPTQYRDRSVEESLDLFRRMRAGEFPDGAHVLRARIDLAAANMLMRDPVLYRIRHAHHYRQRDAWCIYPLYDYAHPIEDALENVTHSLCTLEFENNRELYDWVVENLPRAQPGEAGYAPPKGGRARHAAAAPTIEAYAIAPDSRPEQTEFARLALDYTVMSKRKLLQLVNDGHVSGWDDPRLPTLAGLRRRGVTPEAIRVFCDMVGVARANTRIDIGKLEYAVRDDLNQRAPRAMCVLRPLRMVITNWPVGEVEWLEASYWPHDVPKHGSRQLPFSGELYIERDDFMEDPPKGFFRLTPGGEVRLRHAYIIRCDEVVRNDAGDVMELRCSYDPATRSGTAGAERKVKGTLHWLSAAQALTCEVRLYDRLFGVPDPEADDAVDFREHLNPDSLVVVGGALVEPGVGEAEGVLRRAARGDGAARLARYQFERLGYFAEDAPDSTGGRLVFNRIVTLRDTWAKRRGSEGSRATDGRSVRAGERGGERAGTDERERAVASGRGGQRRAEKAARLMPERTAELAAKRARYVAELGVSPDQADVVTRDAAVAAFFEDALATSAHPGAIAKWLVNDVPRAVRERLGELPVRGRDFGALVDLVETGEISNSAGREVLAELLERGGEPAAIVERLGLRQVSDEAALSDIVDEIVAGHEAKAAEYRAGKKGLLGFFVGQVMARTGGRANPELVRALLEQRLG